MQKKIRILRLTVILLVVMFVLFFNLACSKKNEQTKKNIEQTTPYEEQKKTEETVTAKTDQAKTLVNQGLQKEQQDKPEEAVNDYQQAIQMDPYNADAHYLLGAQYHKMNALTSALEEYDKVLKLNPNYPQIHTAIAHVYYVRGINTWLRSAKLDQSTYGEADTLRKLPYKDTAGLNKLITEYQNSLKSDTTDALTYSKLSQAYFILAAGEYQKAIQTNPSDTSAQLYLALTYLEQGYPQKALAQYGILKKVDPHAADVLQTMMEQKKKEKLYYDELRKKKK